MTNVLPLTDDLINVDQEVPGEFGFAINLSSGRTAITFDQARKIRSNLEVTKKWLEARLAKLNADLEAVNAMLD